MIQVNFHTGKIDICNVLIDIEVIGREMKSSDFLINCTMLTGIRFKYPAVHYSLCTQEFSHFLIEDCLSDMSVN